MAWNWPLIVPVMVSRVVDPEFETAAWLVAVTLPLLLSVQITPELCTPVLRPSMAPLFDSTPITLLLPMPVLDVPRTRPLLLSVPIEPAFWMPLLPWIVPMAELLRTPMAPPAATRTPVPPVIRPS